MIQHIWQRARRYGLRHVMLQGMIVTNLATACATVVVLLSTGMALGAVLMAWRLS